MASTGHYSYTSSLVVFQRRMPGPQQGHPITGVQRVNTPLVAAAFMELLQDHPDGRFSRYICEGIPQGFRIGFNYSAHTCRRASRNMSAEQHPEIVDRYLAKECRLGRVRGPWEATQLPDIHISRFGVIPKPHQQGEWSLIVDVLHPARGSVNDGI